MVITLNGEKKNIPSCYEDLTTRQYELLVPELAKEIGDRNYFAMFNILAGTNFTDFHATSENEVTIWNAIRWLVEQPFKMNEMPKVFALKVNGIQKHITIPKKIKALSIGQNIALKQVIEKTKYIDQNISSSVAIYLQPIYDGAKFDSERVEEIKKYVDEMPAYLTRPLGFFLLMSVLPHGSGQMNFLKRIQNNLTMKLKRISRYLQRSEGSISIPT